MANSSCLDSLFFKVSIRWFDRSVVLYCDESGLDNYMDPTLPKNEIASTSDIETDNVRSCE